MKLHLLHMLMECYIPYQTPLHPSCRESWSFEGSTQNASSDQIDEQGQVKLQYHCWGQQPHMSMHLYGCQAAQSDQALQTLLQQQKHCELSPPFSPPIIKKLDSQHMEIAPQIRSLSFFISEADIYEYRFLKAIHMSTYIHK